MSGNFGSIKIDRFKDEREEMNNKKSFLFDDWNQIPVEENRRGNTTET
jgi:hypothetical protein